MERGNLGNFFNPRELPVSGSPLHVSGEGWPKAGVGALTREGKNTLYVLCGDGQALKILSVTPEGKKAMAAGDFINGYRLADGDRLE